MLHEFIGDADVLHLYIIPPRLVEEIQHTATETSAQGVLLNGNQAFHAIGQAYYQRRIQRLGKTGVNHGSLNALPGQFTRRFQRRGYGST